jgi:excisionase family DNA binding protein
MTTIARDDHGEPLLVKPRQACALLGMGLTRLYELIGDGEFDSFLDGRSRKITMKSVHEYIARRLAEAGARPGAAPPHRTKRLSDLGADHGEPRAM